MKILFASAEVFPYSKTGGLGDMANFLPKSLSKQNVSVTIITPYYNSVIPHHKKLTYIGSKKIVLGGFETVINYYSLKEKGLDIIFVQNQFAFERDEFYGYEDDDLRFMIFSYSILEYVDLMDEVPQVIHVNDWQTAPVPHLLDVHYRYKEKYQFIHTLLSIHNLNYQGSFSSDSAKYFNSDFDYTYIHFGDVNFLKTGIVKATKINTVSPEYRNEILTEEYGFALDGSLRERENDLVGILNGIDYQVFNSETDSLITKNYTTRNLKVSKQKNKEAILKFFGLENNDKPLISFIGRLVDQKGIHFMEETFEDLIFHTKATLVILGSGDYYFENYFDYLHNKYPGRILFYRGYNEQLAHLIYAGSDIFLMPSIFEPCGLGQMIAMRYGTIPIVRETGGLKDTVIPYNKYTNQGTGFSFYDKSSYVFKEKIFEALDLYENSQRKWSELIRRAIKVDNSLDKMAIKYKNLYKEIIGG